MSLTPPDPRNFNPLSSLNFPGQVGPFPSVQPFSYPDGLTFQKLFEKYRVWLIEYLIPFVNDNSIGIVDAYNKAAAELAAAMVKYTEEIAADRAAFVAEVEKVRSELDQAIRDNNAHMADEVAAAEAARDAAEIFSNTVIAFQDEAVSQLINKADYAWTGNPNTSTSTESRNGKIVRTNKQINPAPNVVDGYGGISSGPLIITDDAFSSGKAIRASGSVDYIFSPDFPVVGNETLRTYFECRHSGDGARVRATVRFKTPANQESYVSSDPVTVAANTVQRLTFTVTVPSNAVVASIIWDRVDGAPGTVDYSSISTGGAPYFDGNTVADSNMTQTVLNDFIVESIGSIVTKKWLGLDKVDNTADIDKPVSNPVKTELKNYLKKTRNIVFFGDSYTTKIHSSVDSIPVQTAALLGATIAKNYGISGTQIRESNVPPQPTTTLGTQIDAATADTTVDRDAVTDVVLIMGVNNMNNYLPSVEVMRNMMLRIRALYPKAKFWYAANSMRGINSAENNVLDPWQWYANFNEGASLAGWAVAPYAPMWLWGVDSLALNWWNTGIDGVTTRHPGPPGMAVYAGRLAGFMNGESWVPRFNVRPTIMDDAVQLSAQYGGSVPSLSGQSSCFLSGYDMHLNLVVTGMSGIKGVPTDGYKKIAKLPNGLEVLGEYNRHPAATRITSGTYDFNYGFAINAGTGEITVDARVLNNHVNFFVLNAKVPFDRILGKTFTNPS